MIKRIKGSIENDGKLRRLLDLHYIICIIIIRVINCYLTNQCIGYVCSQFTCQLYHSILYKIGGKSTRPSSSPVQLLLQLFLPEWCMQIWSSRSVTIGNRVNCIESHAIRGVGGEGAATFTNCFNTLLSFGLGGSGRNRYFQGEIWKSC